MSLPDLRTLRRTVERDVADYRYEAEAKHSGNALLWRTTAMVACLRSSPLKTNSFWPCDVRMN